MKAHFTIREFCGSSGGKGSYPKTAVRTSILLSLFLVIAAIDMAGADSGVDGKYIVTAAVGANFFDLGDRFGDAGIETSNEFMFSWGFEYRFHENWGVEGRWAGSSGDVKLADDGQEADIDPMYANGNIVYHFTTASRMKPFVTAGLGVAVLDIDRGDTGASETNFAFNVGGGVSIPLDDRFSLRADLRNYIYSVDGISDDSAAALGLPADFSATMNDLAFLTGINVRF